MGVGGYGHYLLFVCARGVSVNSSMIWYVQGRCLSTLLTCGVCTVHPVWVCVFIYVMCISGGIIFFVGVCVFVFCFLGGGIVGGGGGVAKKSVNI